MTETKTQRVVMAGATGFVGRVLTPAIAQQSDMTLVGAIARKAKGQDVGEALGGKPLGVKVDDDLQAVLERTAADVLIDYTHSQIARQHIEVALRHNVAVVVGTSGLTDQDYQAIGQLAAAKGVGVVAAGNFSLTAVLMIAAAERIAEHVPHWELIDYGSAGWNEAPSGTTRELAARLTQKGGPKHLVEPEQIAGEKAARGAIMGRTPVHSVRLPGYYFGCEVLFGLPGERLTLYHEASGAQPFVHGTLLAARAAVKRQGLVRGLDNLLGL